MLIPEPMGDAERVAIRTGWGMAPDDLVVGYVGSMRPGKGHERIVAAMPDLLAQVPNARLVLVGGGPERPAIERQIAALGIGDRVTLTGDVLDARPLFGALDIFVSASEAEGLPNSVLEAAAAGVAIVATAAGGTVEIVADGSDRGSSSPSATTGRCEPAWSDSRPTRISASRLGSAARDHAATAFGIDRFIRETAEFYEEIGASQWHPRAGADRLEGEGHLKVAGRLAAIAGQLRIRRGLIVRHGRLDILAVEDTDGRRGTPVPRA